MEQEKQECEKCSNAHMAAGEAYRHLSSPAQARWTLRDTQEG